MIENKKFTEINFGKSQKSQRLRKLKIFLLKYVAISKTSSGPFDATVRGCHIIIIGST